MSRLQIRAGDWPRFLPFPAVYDGSGAEKLLALDIREC